MNFRESVEYLYGLGNEVLAMKLGLENIRSLLSALGNPQTKYLKVQIAGTNGKGSTCAFLEAVCLSAKIKVGMTTSPHLISITERIKINGAEISENDFAKHATLIRKTAEKLVENGRLETVPTFFEQVTAIAFSAFAEAEIELAILETGLGGRYDATTAANAEVVAITPIDYDHQKILGDTLAKIAAEKAAIIRKDTKVIIAKQKAEAENVIREICGKYDLKPQATDFQCEIAGIDKKKRFVLNFQSSRAKYENVHLNLPGRHQIENAETAILLAETLQENFKITVKNVIKGLQTAIHPGRLEFSQGILFDGAHNVGGASALGEFLDEFIKQPITMIFGAMRDKDLAKIAEIIFPKADKLIFTKVENARSLEPQEFLNFKGEFEIGTVFTTDNAAQAINLARRVTDKNDLILVTGSLYLIGEVKEVLKKEN